jgi:arginine:agmatine antiporter
MPATDKKIGAFAATMMVVSMMMGSGVYLLPAGLGVIGSISLLGWVAATIGAAMVAGVFSLLVILKPGGAGLFSYVGDALGPGAGFVSAVLYWFATWIGGVAVALAVAGYLSVFLPVVAKPPGLTIATIAIVWLLICANMLGARFVARIQGVSLAVGLAPVLLIAIFGWFYFHPAIFTASWNVSGESFVAVVPRSVVMVFWAFLGIECAIVLAPLVRNPARDVPIASLGGLAIAAAIYMSASAAIMGILPAGVLAKSSAPFAAAVVPMLGAGVAAAVAMCAMLKASGTLGVVILGSVTTADSPSMLGQLRNPSAPQEGGTVSPASLIFTGISMSLVVAASASPTLARQFTIVADLTVVICVYVYVAACVALLRMSSAVPQGMRLWVRALAAGALLFCVALIAASESDLLIWSVGAIAIGVLAYVPVQLRRLRILSAAAGA